MKLLLLCFNFISICYFAKAQNTTFGLIQYGHKESLGMGAPIGLDYNASLVFNKTESIYTYKKDSLEGRHINEEIRINKDENNVMLISKITNQIGFINYNNLLKKEFKSRDIGFKYVKETTPKISWKIHSEVKTIGKFKCKMATTNFRGRNYTAWFTTEIPLPFGPWKLQGLPGLILEAYDTNKEIFFYFKSIEYPYVCDYDIEIFPPNPKKENKVWISFDEYKKGLISAYNKAVANGRMFIEQRDDYIVENNENQLSMKNIFFEVFQ